MKWFLPILSGLLLALPFEGAYVWWAGLFALVPFFLFLEYSEASDPKAYPKAFLGGWLLGFIFFALAFRFILYSFPAGWAGVQNALGALPLFTISWVGMSLFIGLSFGLFGLLFLKFSKNFPFLTIPSLWILSEYLRTYMFSLFAWGVEGTLGPHWTFGNLGYIFIDTPVVFWSRLAGLYGLSFLAVCMNVFMYRFLKKEFKLLTPAIVLIVFLVTAPYFIFFRESQGNPVTVALVNTNFLLGSLNETGFETLWNKVKTLPEFQDPQIIVFPEGGNLFSTNAHGSLLEKIFPGKLKTTLLITNTTVGDETGVKERMVYRSADNTVISVQDKTFLMPGGEYLPIVLKGYLYLQDKTILERFNSARRRISVEIAETPIVFEGVSVGALMCSGIVSPILYRSLANQGAEMFVNSASQVVFRNYPFFLRQMKMFARFHAISNARPFVQASNGGQSFFIDSRGNVTKETSSFGSQIIFGRVFPSDIKTLYTRSGDWPLALAALAISYTTIRNRKFLFPGPR